MNYWMRARVGLQGVTLVALVTGAMMIQAEKEKKEKDRAAGIELPPTPEELAKRAKEAEEFEKRLKGAEEAQREEDALLRGKGKGSAAGLTVKAEEVKIQGVEEGQQKRSWWKLW